MASTNSLPSSFSTQNRIRNKGHPPLPVPCLSFLFFFAPLFLISFIDLPLIASPSCFLLLGPKSFCPLRILQFISMSFDRVLPRPTGPYYNASQCSQPRISSNPREHKIMNDVSKMAVNQPYRYPHRDGGPVGASCKYATDVRSPGVPLLALNPAEIALSSLKSLQPATLLLTKEISIQDRSSHCSPVESAIVKEPGQFYLCQPNPEIPRPRDGIDRDKSPDSPCPMTPYTPGTDAPQSRPLIYAQWQYQHGKDNHPPDLSLNPAPSGLEARRQAGKFSRQLFTAVLLTTFRKRTEHREG